MKYRVEVSRKVGKYLAGLHNADLQRRLIGAMRGLESDPRPPGCVKLSGDKDLFRIRVGDYRIVYQVQDRVLVVLVVDIGHRREIYKS